MAPLVLKNNQKIILVVFLFLHIISYFVNTIVNCLEGVVFLNNDNNQNLNILDEVNKGSTMGINAISCIFPKVQDSDFRKVLNVEKDKYEKISERVNDLYANYSQKEPHETNAMEKFMTWYGIQMNTIKDNSTSKLSELLMQGTNMGIIEGRRLINHNSNVGQDVKNILNDFVVMQEDSVETLKKYL